LDALIPASLSLLEAPQHLLFSVLGISKSCCVTLSSVVYTFSNCSLFRVFLIWGKRKKSQGIMSWECGGWHTYRMWCLPKNCRTIWAKCASVLSWWICDDSAVALVG